MQITGARFFDGGGFSVLAGLLAPEARVNTSRHQTTLNLMERNAMNRKVRTIGAAAMFAALIGFAAGCSSSPPGSGSPSATGPATSAAAATGPVSSAPASTASAAIRPAARLPRARPPPRRAAPLAASLLTARVGDLPWPLRGD